MIMLKPVTEIAINTKEWFEAQIAKQPTLRQKVFLQIWNALHDYFIESEIEPDELSLNEIVLSSDGHLTFNVSTACNLEKVPDEVLDVLGVYSETLYRRLKDATGIDDDSAGSQWPGV
jgi:hypothetical protein